jgi:hypothetical protein
MSGKLGLGRRSMNAFYLTLAIGAATMMSMFAAAYATKFEALGRIGSLDAQQRISDGDVF